MKATKTFISRKPGQILVGFIAACAVVGLASAASAQTHNWSTTAPTLSWSDPANWTPAASVPGAGNTVRFELSVADAAKGTIIMDKNYNGLAGNPTLDYVRFTGNEVVSIQNYLKVTSNTTALQMQNGGSGGTNVSVPVGGTIAGTVNLANEGSRTPPTLNFTGGNWVAGNVKTESGNRQGGILKVSSSSGTLTPGAVLVSLAPEVVANRARFYFDLDAAGVVPIAFQHATDPIQFTGAAAGTNPFNLTVEAADYAGAGVDIPLITHTTDADRLFSAGNITIANVPDGKGGFVTQANTGTTLTLADAVDWSGGASPIIDWSDTGNWTGGNVPGLTLARTIANFPAGVTNVTVSLNGTSPTLAVLNINSGAAAASDYSIGQGTGGNINLGATPAGSLHAAAQFNVLNGANNTISAPVALNMNARVTAAASTSLAMSGEISGAFSFTKCGAGTLVLSGGANSYSGETVIEGGLFSVSSLANTGSPSDLGNYPTPGAAGIVLKGGTLRYAGSTTGSAIDRGITVATGSTGTVNVAASTALKLGASELGQESALKVTGAGTGSSSLSLGATTLTGATNMWGYFNPITADLAVASVTSSTGNKNIRLGNFADRSGTTANSTVGDISIGTGMVQTFSGTWTLTGNNAYSDITYIACGTLKVSSSANLGTSTAYNAIQLGNVDGHHNMLRLLNDSSTNFQKPVRLWGNGNIYVGKAEGGTGSSQTHTLGAATYESGKSITITGDSGYGLTFGAGTLNGNFTLTNSLGAPGVLTLASLTRNGNAMFTVSGPGDTAISGNVLQTGGVLAMSKSGTGTLTLSGANTYTGATTVTAGTLALAGGSQSSPITVNSGAFLAFDVAAPTTSTSTYNFMEGSKIRIIGTPAASFTLTTSSGITGTPVLEAPVAGYELMVDGTTLKLVSGSLFQITSIVRNPDTGAVTITFPSSDTAIYTVEATTGLVEWRELNDSVDGQAGETSYTDADFAINPSLKEEVFYRVSRNP